jgi:hypothetical protein
VGHETQPAGDGRRGRAPRYGLVENRLRPSIVADPLFLRKNTGDNTPSVVHVELVAGDKVDVTVAAKGGGSENKSTLAMLNPNDSLVDWCSRRFPGWRGWCPPACSDRRRRHGDKAMVLAKEALMDPIDMHELLERGPANKLESCGSSSTKRSIARDRRAGLGGLTTVLDVKIRTFPTHAASKPVAMIPNCAATRHAHFVLDGSGPVALEPPPARPLARRALEAPRPPRRVDLRALTREEVASWKPGQTLLLTGRMFTGRDAAHKRLEDGCEMARGCRRTSTSRGVSSTTWASRSRCGRGRRPRGPDDRDAHGQVHGHDPRHRPARDDRQGRARARRDRFDPAARRRVPDRGRRRRVSRLQGDPQGAHRRVRRPRAWRPCTSSRSRTCRSPWRSDARGGRYNETGPKAWAARIKELKIPVRVA